MKMRTKTFKQAEHYLNVTMHVAFRDKDKATALKMLRAQKKIAEDLEGRARRGVIRRKKRYAGKYSPSTFQTESAQIESMYWYRRHIGKLDDKMHQVKTRT
ncbi:hypothetical protein T484DRAFT_1756990 [Baffinella frigidus]|nr:hypothetical protein T484DRAFT_1756990 [Cryptophyta sp. CCMP2293]